jgi:hypothetical protein
MSKFNYRKFVASAPQVTCFDEPGTGEPKTFTMTQSQLDAIVTTRSQSAIAEANAKASRAEEAGRTALAQLETLKTSGMSPEDRERHESELADLRKKVLTADELRAQELKKKDKEYQDRLTAAEANEKKWKSAHDDLLIDFGIESAAVAKEVENGMLVLVKAHLKPQTKLVPETDEQGNIRKYIPTIDYVETDDKGVVKTLTLPVDQVMAKMKEKPEFAPLFKGTKKAGVGGSNGSNGSTENPDTMTPEQYQEWHKRTGKW